MLDMAGKVALVTGCGSTGDGWSNGQAQAVLFARRGARVYGVDLNQTAGQRTLRYITSEGGACHVVVGDVRQAETANDLIADCVRHFGSIDVLINNVGRSAPGDAVTTSDELWAEQLDINLTSTFRMCRAAIPQMQKQERGAIVNVASIGGIRYTGKPQLAYATSKAALIQFTRMAAVMHAKNGIRLNCVVPGFIDTPLVKRLAEQFADGDYDAFTALQGARVPMGRMGDAWDVAHASLFLASDEARYITGTELVVDGGVTVTIQ